MTTKLTLTIEEQVIDTAKEYARKEGKSLSGIVENYLKIITAQQNTALDLSPKIAKMMGAITLPDGYDYKKELGKVLVKKYNKSK